jgi:hypothetical protein
MEIPHMNIHRVSDKLTAVLEMLAVSQASLQNRLVIAFTGELSKLPDSCFPPALLEKWQSIRESVRKALDMRGFRPVVQLTNAEARRLIKELFLLARDLERSVAVDDYIWNSVSESCRTLPTKVATTITELTTSCLECCSKI